MRRNGFGSSEMYSKNSENMGNKVNVYTSVHVHLKLVISRIC